MKNMYARLVFLGATLAAFGHGCSDASVRCLGTPSECANRSADDCVSGCSLRRGCLGERVQCDTISNNLLCEQPPGCGLRGTCEGEASCTQLSASQCRMTAGCQYVVGCVGDGTPCESLEEDLCGLYPQCAFESQCYGKAQACDEVDSYDQCQQVPGCYLADTDPSVVR
jgi:hypothetical protein